MQSYVTISLNFLQLTGDPSTNGLKWFLPNIKHFNLVISFVASSLMLWTVEFLPLENTCMKFLYFGLSASKNGLLSFLAHNRAGDFFSESISLFTLSQSIFPSRSSISIFLSSDSLHSIAYLFVHSSSLGTANKRHLINTT